MLRALLSISAASLTIGSAATAQSAGELACAAVGGLPVAHTIMVERRGFFPTITYVCPGDTVQFINSHSDTAHFFVNGHLGAGSEEWSDEKAPGELYDIVLTVAPGMTYEFDRVRAAPSNYSQPAEWNGKLVYGFAPDAYADGERYDDSTRQMFN